MLRLGKQAFFFSSDDFFGSSSPHSLKDLCQGKGGAAFGGWGGEGSHGFLN